MEKKTFELPAVITDRIRQVREELNIQTVKAQSLIHGLCEAQMLGQGLKSGNWTLSPDGCRIECEGSEESNG